MMQNSSPRPVRRIFFLSAHPARAPSSWSGTLRSLVLALESNDAGLAVEEIRPVWLSWLSRFALRVTHKLGQQVDLQLTSYFAFVAGMWLTLRLAFLLPPGPVVAVAVSNYLPFLFTRRTVIYISDATFRCASRIYPAMRAMPRWAQQQADWNEGRSLRMADYVILSSEWARRSALDDYGISAGKVHVLPFGANIENAIVDRYQADKTISRADVNCVFVSADWERKGGPKAIAICEALRAAGFDATLTVIGSAPDSIMAMSFVERKGFLRKDDPAGLAELCECYRRAHFLLLPTIADASPIVFPEAQAFGVVPITHRVGGTESSMEHGRTGLLLPLDATPQDFVAALTPYIANSERYEALSKNCREWYLNGAQWSRWRDLILAMMRRR